jgi:hypothetical protein
MRKHLLAIVAASTLVLGSSAFAADLEDGIGHPLGKAAGAENNE